jgi:hypothetical protein
VDTGTVRGDGLASGGGRRAVRVSAAVAVVSMASVSCTGSQRGAEPPATGSRDSQTQALSSSRATEAQATTVWSKFAARPLRLPPTGAGDSCPVTRLWSTRREADLPAGLLSVPLLGAGPVFPGIATAPATWRSKVTVQMAHPRHPAFSLPGGWLIQKVLWAVSRTYTGPALIRGHRIDGPGQMRFYGGDGRQRRFGSHQLRLSGQGGDHPSEFLVPSPGCYAWQVEGVGINTTLVFRAVGPPT